MEGSPASISARHSLKGETKVREFITVGLNGLTLGALYFLVASGFSLVFGLMRVVNLAHGSLYLLGAYVGWSIGDATGNWFLALISAPLLVAVVGILIQQGLLRRIQGQDLREALVTIGVSIVVADLLLAHYGGQSYELTPPDAINGSTFLGLFNITYPTFRLFTVGLALVVGGGLWLLLRHTRLGLMIRAGIDDRDMVSALGINIQRVFAIVFGLGALLAGLAGIIAGSALSVGPGDDGLYLLYSLIVVIIGGMGSVGGAALGALLVGLVGQFALAYAPTYSILLTFAMMILVLAVRPQGLVGRTV
jgi:branched-chain amino acid transport system permease protein